VYGAVDGPVMDEDQASHIPVAVVDHLLEGAGSGEGDIKVGFDPIEGGGGCRLQEIASAGRLNLLGWALLQQHGVTHPAADDVVAQLADRPFWAWCVKGEVLWTDQPEARSEFHPR
jgi:hypothetical protein